MSKVKIYAKSIGLPLAIGILLGILISRFMDYGMLQKPFLAPPAIIFPIVWTILYILMGVSEGMLMSKCKADTESEGIYRLQLIVNVLWPILFFVLKWRVFALLWIILLGILVYKMIMTFYRRDKVAGLLQIPYFVWIIFATYLNLGIVILN